MKIIESMWVNVTRIRFGGRKRHSIRRWNCYEIILLKKPLLHAFETSILICEVGYVTVCDIYVLICDTGYFVNRNGTLLTEAEIGPKK